MKFPILLSTCAMIALSGAALAETPSPPQATSGAAAMKNAAAPPATAPIQPHQQSVQAQNGAMAKAGEKTSATLAHAEREHRELVHAREQRIARRETNALNLLESKGFGNYKDFRPQGKDFAAEVTRNGKVSTVLVNPETGSLTTKS